MIIFTNLRDSVKEICRALHWLPSVIIGSFAGQSDDKYGSKGLSQQEQQEVCKGNYLLTKQRLLNRIGSFCIMIGSPKI